MKSFIATVELESLDGSGIESGFITTTYVPVIAPNEDEASKKAVVWQSDNGKAVKSEELTWECRERQRKLVWKVSKCLLVSEDEKNFFLSLTQGLSTAKVCE